MQKCDVKVIEKAVVISMRYFKLLACTLHRLSHSLIIALWRLLAYTSHSLVPLVARQAS